jgi:hypothetical protein
MRLVNQLITAEIYEFEQQPIFGPEMPILIF